MRPLVLDDVDERLLELLQRDCSRTLLELGREIGLSASAVQRRIGRLERRGVIGRRTAVLNAAALGEFVHALVLVTLEQESSERHSALQSQLKACAAVQQCYDLAGEHDYAVMLVARGMSELRRLVDGLFLDAPNVKRYVTLPVYDVVKAGLELPVRQPAA